MNEKKYIVLKGLEGNPPAELNAVQLFLEPYVNYIIAFWWILWWSVLIYMVVRYLVLPLRMNRGCQTEATEANQPSGEGI